MFLTGALWGGSFRPFVRKLTENRVDPWTWIDCRISSFFFYLSTQYSSALLSIMSIEKFFALYFPLKTRSVCTVKTAKWVSLISFLLYVAYNSHNFVVWGNVNSAVGKTCKIVRLSSEFRVIFSKVRSILYSFAPFAIMGLMNLAIIFKFMRAKYRSRNESTESTNQALSNAALKSTAMLITVALTFIILTAPIAIFVAAQFDKTNHRILYSSIIMLRYINHGINGVLYCICGSKFRQELVALFNCCTGNKNDSQGVNSERSNSTYVRWTISHLVSRKSLNVFDTIIVDI